MENKNKYSLIEYSDNSKDLKENQYSLASVWRILFARLFDLIIGSIPMALIDWIWHSQAGDVTHLIIRYSVALVWMFGYFVILPIFWQGNTLGKKIFKLQLIHLDKSKIKFTDILKRESWFIFIPWIVGTLATIIFALLMPSSYSDADAWKISLSVLIYQLGLIFVIIWWCALMVFIKVQDLHQSMIDMKLKIIVVDTKPQEKIKSHDFDKTISRDEKHISLKDQPGNFDKEFIDSIKNKEKHEFNKSINLDKKHLVEDLKIENNKKENNKKIETGDKNGDR